MTKYNAQNRLDEKAIAAIAHFFVDKHGDDFDLQFHGVKDSTPDTDGFIRLRKKLGFMKGEYVNKVVFFQLKGQADSIKENSYRCNKKVIDFCKEINLPTILIVVGNLKIENEPEIYWYYFSDSNIEILKSLSPNPRSRSVKIPNLEVLKTRNVDHNIDYSDTFYKFIEDLAKRDHLKDLPADFLNLVVDYKDTVVDVASLIYLFGNINKIEKNKIENFLKLSSESLNFTLNGLISNGTIIDSENTFIFKNYKDQIGRYLGLRLLYQSVSRFDFNKILVDFPEKKQQINLFSNLAEVRHPNVQAFLFIKIGELLTLLKHSKNNDEIYFQLELLSQYFHRVPNQTLLILKQIINTKNPLKPKINTVKGWGKVKGKGKTHEDLLMKTIELLEKMRYLKQKEVFTLLLKMTQFKDEKIIKRANESLSRMAKYNLHALKKIAYQPQLLLIEQIEKFSPEKIKKYFESLLIIQKELLNPSYEGFEDTDYQTLTIQSGTLVANKDLEQIRKKAIIALKKIFPLCTSVAQQKKVLETLNSAIRVPMEGGSEELRALILENTKNIIHYYIQLIPELENEIIQVIDKDFKWLKKRYPDMEALKELEATLAKNGDYKIFTTLVGHQFNFEENIGWEKAEQQRKEKINELVSEINEENFESWEQKILSIAKGFYHIEENKGQYLYFNLFLDELAKAKPILAQKIIEQHEKDLEPFLLNLIGGIWKSDNPKIAKAFIQKWTQSGHHLDTCALVFAYVKKLDEPLLQSIFKKAKQTKNSDALINIIRSISNNYPESKHLTPLFLEVIQELTKLKNIQWINWVYFQKNSIITHLGEKDFDLILANLVFARNIDYEIEQILMPLAEKNSLKILDFLKKRILRQKNEKDTNYRAIPFHFSKLDKIFEKNEALVASELFKWLEEDALIWETSQLIKNTLPLNEAVDKKLAQLLHSKSKNALKIFHTLMMVYQGLISLENKFVHVIIKNFPEEHAELMNYMSMAGKVVMGENGFVEDLEKKKAALEKWKKDKRKYIREFVEKYSNYLTERIEYEKKRADEDLALRKSEFKG